MKFLEMEANSIYHNAVLLKESVEGLAIKPEGTYVDVTFGAGGHARAILNMLNENGRLFAFDQDEESLQNTIKDNRFTLINANFKYMKNHLNANGIRQVDGILADLGVSSHQFDAQHRGFAIRFDCSLDMRMDTRKHLTAKDILNTYSETELRRIFYDYGEIHNANKLSALIVAERKQQPFDMSVDFQKRIASCIPTKREFKYLAQVYQALRIEVNDELKALEMLLLQSRIMIRQGGRLVVISYHSLEDRLTKFFIRSGNFEDKIEKDIYGNNLSPFVAINRKTIVPAQEELDKNNRSRSAKLRIAERSAYE